MGLFCFVFGEFFCYLVGGLLSGAGCFVFWKSWYYWYSSLEITFLLFHFRNGQKKWISLKRLVHLYICLYKCWPPLWSLDSDFSSTIQWTDCSATSWKQGTGWLDTGLKSSSFPWWACPPNTLSTLLLPSSVYPKAERTHVRRAPLPSGFCFWLGSTSGKHQRNPVWKQSDGDVHSSAFSTWAPSG